MEGMKQTTKSNAAKMQRINFFSGRDRKPWASIEIPAADQKQLEAEAKRKGLTYTQIWEEAISEGLKRHRRRTTVTKTLCLPESVLTHGKARAREENRTFSNYVDALLRRDVASAA